MQKFILILFSFFLSITTIVAQTITVSAPNVVELGEIFQISYTLNEQSNGQQMSLTKVDALEQLGAPSSGIKSHMVVSNGQVGSVVHYTETYRFRALKTGKFKTPIASATVNGKTISSKAQNIEVSDFPKFTGSTPKSQSQNRQQSQPKTLQQLMLQQMQQMQEIDKQGQQQMRQQQQRSNRVASGEDFFTRVEVSKTKSFIGEPIHVALKLYTQYNYSDNGRVVPTFDGFYKKVLYEPAYNERIYSTQETINGRKFKVYTFQKLMIFPQKSGDLVITPFEIDANVEVSDYLIVRKIAQSPQVIIKVHDFPAGKTANFTGAVGDFQVQAKADVQQIAADEAFTFRFTVSGQGNLSLLQKPKIDFPQTFEVYDPKVIDNFGTTTQGDKGNKIFEYVIIPSQAGNFEIPAIEFQYFNSQTKTFKTLKTNVIPIEVTKSTGKKSQAVNFATSKSQLAYKGDDILFIKTGDLQLKKTEKSSNFFPRTYTILAILLSIGTLVFIILKRKQIEFNSDESRVKNKKADAETKKRLKQARLCLEAGKETEFYDELAKALWGYVSDKFTIPLSALTIDTVREFLTQQNIENSLIQDLIDVLNHCNFARYAPSGAAANRELLERSVALILAFQKKLGNRK
ncbi:MAG: BatD family protein [Bacteroidetes bacterium]|nr:BatD family protein [Bacteroidota bacterium]